MIIIQAYCNTYLSNNQQKNTQTAIIYINIGEYSDVCVLPRFSCYMRCIYFVCLKGEMQKSAAEGAFRLLLFCFEEFAEGSVRHIDVGF